MSAPIGNKNAANAKVWRAAIERAIERRGEPAANPDIPFERAPKVKALDELADKFVAACALSDLGFMKELGDRLDGKPAQQLQLSGDPDGDPIRQSIEQIIVDANDPPR